MNVLFIGTFEVVLCFLSIVHIHTNLFHPTVILNMLYTIFKCIWALYDLCCIAAARAVSVFMGVRCSMFSLILKEL